MAFKAVIHYPANQEQMKEIHKTIAHYRAEKTVKYLANIGITNDILQDILYREEIQIPLPK